MARKVFISVLGFTNYGECIYVKDEYKSSPVRFIQEATLKYLQLKGAWTVDDVAYVLLTPEAEAANWVDNGQRDRQTKQVIPIEGLQSRLQRLNLPFEVHKIDNLPHGNSEGEIWEIFERLFAQLQDGDELYFDLTHGFRYLPMLVMVLINYSKFLRNTKVCSITYGNYESRNTETNEAPIIDLLPLSVLQDWTFAAGQYIDAGNVNRLAQLGKEKITPILRKSEGKDVEAKALQQMIKFLELSVQDMQTCRGVNLLEATNLSPLKQLMSKLQSTSIKPLNPVFEKIKDSFCAFSDVPDVTNGFVAAKWCADHELYQQAITILQENIVTLVCKESGLDEKDDTQRSLVNSAFAIVRKNLPQEEWKFAPNLTEEELMRCRSIVKSILGNDKIALFGNIFTTCTQVRNDFNHSGMRPSPSASQVLKKRIISSVESAIEVYSNNPPIAVVSKSPLFINLTNHPSNQWSEEQCEAARVYGEVVDMPFPAVDEWGDEAYIAALADEYMVRVMKYAEEHDVTVHLMGELTFCFALLGRLRQQGIPVVASTSQRIVSEESGGHKVVTFRFSRFRRYE